MFPRFIEESQIPSDEISRIRASREFVYRRSPSKVLRDYGIENKLYAGLATVVWNSPGILSEKESFNKRRAQKDSIGISLSSLYSVCLSLFRQKYVEIRSMTHRSSALPFVEFNEPSANVCPRSVHVAVRVHSVIRTSVWVTISGKAGTCKLDAAAVLGGFTKNCSRRSLIFLCPCKFYRKVRTRISIEMAWQEIISEWRW